MEWIDTPESSNIVRFGYDSQAQILAVEFIEVLINHLCVDMSVLGVEVERLLLSVAESVYHLPVVGEPGAERLEVDATV